MIFCRLKLQLLLPIIFSFSCFYAQTLPVRENILIDQDWKFAFGHPSDTQKDFNHAIAYFSYLTKAGNGDGPAATVFDDRAWRKLDLPHDWAVEQPFDKKGSFSHGFKASGKGFPEKSVGWYRKSIIIPESDLGKIISLQFDGVFRHAQVWLNGHYLGVEDSGYNEFEHDITAYINYGKENVISVRVDATLEEGWYYEGAGIYRHVYLKKTQPLHVKTNGTYITTPSVNSKESSVKIETTVVNKGHNGGIMEIFHKIVDPQGNIVSETNSKENIPNFYQTIISESLMKVQNPMLWDIENPHLYKIITQIKKEGKIVDEFVSKFGIRTIKFDPENGFFLNGKHVKLKGTNNHQDHAGVGVALPDELQYWRIKKLKEMGSNAYRTSHHPPTKELLDACDELGMLVIDETRLMGINDLHLNNLKKLIERDRNRPSVIAWSVGNEEWKIEGNDMGKRIAQVLQDYTKQLEPSRPVTIGLSSGFQSGISDMVEIIGYNYLGNGDIDAHRNQFKHQPGMGTEEGSTWATRGIYFNDEVKQYKSSYDQKPRPTFYSIQEGWKFYANRPYLAGMFIWTGFDYRGEPTPYGWPSTLSYFGMMDNAGFPKDNFYYLKSWWGKDPVLHLLPHWNWEGKEGEDIDVWVYSNAEEVELFLNKKSLGKKKMEFNGHLAWKVPYQKGVIEAIGYKNGQKFLTTKRQTTGEPQRIEMSAHKNVLKTSTDLAVITVEVLDKNGLNVPTANNEIQFSVKGGGKIIGVGNGNPSSLENDRFIDGNDLFVVTNLKEQKLDQNITNQYPTLSSNLWQDFFETKDKKTNYAYQGNLQLPKLAAHQTVEYFYVKLGEDSKIFINGEVLSVSKEDTQKYIIPNSILKEGLNELLILAAPQKKINPWDEPNINPGVVRIYSPSEGWKRKLFNGYAQLIVQNDGSSDDIVIVANGENLKSKEIIIKKK